MLRDRLAASGSCVVLMGALVSIAPLQIAAAQEAAPPEAGRGIETVTITAQKRAEDVQDVPLSVVAVGGDDLRENQITQLQNIRQIDPSVQFRVSTGKTTSAFSMRGVGTSTFAIGVEQSVSVVVDGVALAQPGSLTTLADVERVEVLKGPQGMLFGKNAAAGVISIITKDPIIGEWGGEAHVSLGANEEQIVELASNIPISDTMALRLTASRNHLQGWITDPVLNNETINNINDNGMRGKLLWRPNDRLKVTLGSDFSYDGEFCCTQVQLSTPNPLSASAVSNAMYGVVASPDNRQITFGTMPRGKSRTLGVNANVEYDLGGDYTLTSITGWRNFYNLSNYDADLSVFNYVDNNGGRQKQRTFSEEIRLTSPADMEAPFGSFDYVGGLFFYAQDGKSTIGDQVGYVVAPALGTVTIPTNARLSSVTGTNTVTSNSNAAFAQAKYKVDDLVPGLSFTAGVRFTRDEIDLTYRRGPAPGAYNGLVGNGPIIVGQPLQRVNNIDPKLLPLRTGNQYIGYTGPFIGTSNASATGLSSVGCIAGSTVPFPTGVNCFPALVQGIQNDNWSYRLTVQEEFTPDIMAYFTFARGYKGPGVSGSTAPNFVTAGGFPPFSTNPEAISQLVRPEIPLTGELGFKSELLDNTLLLNVNYFVSKFKGYQTQTNVSTPNGFVGRVANAEALNLRGLELAAQWSPIDNLDLSFSGTWEKGTYGNLPVPCIFTDSRLQQSPAGVVSVVSPTPTGGEGCGTTVPNGTGGFIAGQLNAKGNTLTNLPDFQYRVGASYEKPNLIGDLVGYLNLKYAWQDKVYFNPNGNEFETQEAYGLLGGEIGIGASDDRWRVSIYGSNILDQNFASAINIAPTQVLNPAGYYRYTSSEAFAHYGVRLDYSF